jgi:hypothetical protein
MTTPGIVSRMLVTPFLQVGLVPEIGIGPLFYVTLAAVRLMLPSAVKVSRS